MIRYVLLIVFLTVYAECASVSTDKPPDCGDNGVWMPCGVGCQLPCSMQKLASYPDCNPVCNTYESRGACGCKDGYGINVFGKCDKC